MAGFSGEDGRGISRETMESGTRIIEPQGSRTKRPCCNKEGCNRRRYCRTKQRIHENCWFRKIPSLKLDMTELLNGLLWRHQFKSSPFFLTSSMLDLNTFMCCNHQSSDGDCIVILCYAKSHLNRTVRIRAFSSNARVKRIKFKKLIQPYLWHANFFFSSVC